MNSGTDDGVKATTKIVSIEMFVMMRMGIKRMRMMIMIYDDDLQVVKAYALALMNIMMRIMITMVFMMMQMMVKII